MSETCVIEEQRGLLFVRDNWQHHYTQPVAYRLAWPTGLIARDWAHLIGQKCTPAGEGCYRLADGSMLALEARGLTHPTADLTEERRIPKLPGQHEYRNGRWTR